MSDLRHVADAKPLAGTAGNLDLIYTKIAKRTIPFLMLLFVLAWMDRVNVGFARLRMVSDLGFSEAVFGFGAGIFFLGYFLFEVPSNLLLERIGARKTLARIAVLWGLASVGTMFVTTATQFYVLRFLLGAFEAGLYPGVLLYLTYWFPARRRARMLGYFMTAVPIAGIVGGPISGWIMASMGGVGGLANWQWLFLLEGLPSVIVGLATLAVVVDSPGQAPWLSAAEKEAVLSDLESDRLQAGARQHGFLEALRVPEVWLLALISFCLVSANPTLGFWSPTIINGMGVQGSVAIGLLSALPYLAAMIAVVVVGRSSDRTLERRYHCALACLSAGLGLILIGVFEGMAPLAFLALVVAQAGVLAAMVPFWQMPTMLLAGTAAAGGIALINSFGNLSGWLGPFIVGWLRDLTGKTSSGLYVVAGLEVLATVLILLFIPKRVHGQEARTGTGHEVVATSRAVPEARAAGLAAERR
jgi:D-galactonate transporter